MRRSLGSVWLKSLKSLGKTQERAQKKLVKSLTAATQRAVKAAAKTAAKSAAKSVVKPVVKTARKPAAKPVTKPAAKPAAKSAVKQRLKPAARTPPAKVEPALPGSWTSAFYAPAGGPRMAYWLYLPRRDPAVAHKPMPLVVMLHGCSQTATAFAQGTRMNALAQRKGFAVLYPQQLLTIDPNRCWQWYRSATQLGGGEAALVAGALTQVVERHALDASRVYVAGISAGAALAEIVALRYPYRVAAVGLHSGPVFGTVDNRLAAFAVMQQGALHGVEQAVQMLADAPDFPGMPAMLLHGEADKVVRPVNLQQVARQFCLVNGLDAAKTPPLSTLTPARPGGRSPRRAFQRLDYRLGTKPVVSVCRIAGLDHAWSGGDGTQRFNDSSGPDASALLWAFFAKHKRKRSLALRKVTK